MSSISPSSQPAGSEIPRSPEVQQAIDNLKTFRELNPSNENLNAKSTQKTAVRPRKIMEWTRAKVGAAVVGALGLAGLVGWNIYSLETNKSLAEAARDRLAEIGGKRQIAAQTAEKLTTMEQELSAAESRGDEAALQSLLSHIQALINTSQSIRATGESARAYALAGRGWAALGDKEKAIMNYSNALRYVKEGNLEEIMPKEVEKWEKEYERLPANSMPSN